MRVERHQITTLTVAGEPVSIDHLELYIRREPFLYSWDAAGIVSGVRPRELKAEPEAVVMIGANGTYSGLGWIETGITVSASDSRTSISIRGTGDLEGA